VRPVARVAWVKVVLGRGFLLPNPRARLFAHAPSGLSLRVLGWCGRVVGLTGLETGWLVNLFRSKEKAAPRARGSAMAAAAAAAVRTLLEPR
jgi:hypothetical protein